MSRAKAQNKYIFVDCYTSWCGYCKEMEKEVFPKAWVGEFMNDHFISVRVQYDSSSQDDEYVRNWYPEAHLFISANKVTGYPSYLYFSPEGEIVHRGVGKLSDSEFVKLAMKALDPATQYYTNVKKFKDGRMPLGEMAVFSQSAEDNGDKDLADQVARHYYSRFLNTLSAQEFLMMDHLLFVGMHPALVTTNDKVFKEMLTHSREVDSLITGNPHFAEKCISFVIINDMVDKRLYPDNHPIARNPDWSSMKREIRRNYGRGYADTTILESQIRWYKKKKDWANLSKYELYKFDKYGLDTAGGFLGLGWMWINNMLYSDIFQHCTDKRELRKAARWMKVIVDLRPNDGGDIDTYANLLYKSGNVKAALFWEEKAVSMDPKDAGIKAALDKMQKGLPTWPL